MNAFKTYSRISMTKLRCWCQKKKFELQDALVLSLVFLMCGDTHPKRQSLVETVRSNCIKAIQFDTDGLQPISLFLILQYFSVMCSSYCSILHLYYPLRTLYLLNSDFQHTMKNYNDTIRKYSTSFSSIALTSSSKHSYLFLYLG